MVGPRIGFGDAAVYGHLWRAGDGRRCQLVFGNGGGSDGRPRLPKRDVRERVFRANDLWHVNHRWHDDGALCFCTEPPCTRCRRSSSGGIRDQYRWRCLPVKNVNARRAIA